MNPNWREADYLAIYMMQSRSWTQGYWEMNSYSGKVEDLNQEPPAFKSNTPNYMYSAMSPSLLAVAHKKVDQMSARSLQL